LLDLQPMYTCKNVYSIVYDLATTSSLEAD